MRNLTHSVDPFYFRTTPVETCLPGYWEKIQPRGKFKLLQRFARWLLKVTRYEHCEVYQQFTTHRLEGSLMDNCRKMIHEFHHQVGEPPAVLVVGPDEIYGLQQECFSKCTSPFEVRPDEHLPGNYFMGVKLCVTPYFRGIIPLSKSAIEK